jgi:amino acid adenylation domain-containing protein
MPLSFAQQRLWFLDQLVPGNPFYNVPAALRLTGQLDLLALQQTFQAIFQRHEALRTNFIKVDGQPAQIIATHVNLALPILDLQSLPSSQRELAAQQILIEEAQRPFNLAGDRLLRVKLLQLQAREFVLLLNLHHIVADGWSLGVLIRELGTLYAAFHAHQSPALPELPIQYADFAHWQRQWLQGEVLASQLTYWRQQLAALPVLDLPRDRPRPALPTYRGATHPLALSSQLSASLVALSQQTGVTLFMTLLAAFQTLLYRYTGQEDMVLGAPIANRNRSEVEGLIGFFVNSLVLRVDLSGNPSFQSLLQRVRQVTLAAYDHQDLPFEKLVEALHPERDLSRNPLFQVVFALQNAPVQPLALPELTLNPLPFEVSTTRFDLELHLWEPASGLSGLWEEVSPGLSGFIAYSPELFDASRIARLVTHFQTLLESIVAHPETPIADLPLLSAAERHQLLVAWNQTHHFYADQLCIHQRFAAQAARSPAAIAAVLDNQQLTYQELDQRANQLAHYLQTLKVAPEVLVGICLDRSLEMLVAILGVWKAGGAYVPLDPSYPRERLQFMLTDTQLTIVLTQRSQVETLPEFPAQLICLDQDWPTIATYSDKPPISDLTADHLAYVIYTSGSTGKPKGVLLQHRGLSNVIDAQIQVFNLQPENRVLQFSALSFDASIFEMLLAFGVGATLYLPPQSARLPGPELVNFLQAKGIDTAILPPAVLSVLPAAALPELRTVISGGEACAGELVKQWAHGRRFFNAYGPTETTIWATVAELRDGDAPPSIGRPVANTQIYLLDAHLNPVAIGVTGEIYIGGDGLARSYLHRPELTAERFIDSPYSRLYKTGDLGRYLPDGNLEFFGRLDDQVKIRGFRIELGEIESLLQQHPSVREAVAIADGETSTGKRLTAYLTLNLESSFQEQLQQWQTQQLQQWQALYDQTYGQPLAESEPTFNLVGWQSSYTGEPIPAEQMRQWVRDRVEQILALQPQRVLEIGCGTGLLLFQIAPHCRQYWGTDFSSASLQSIEQQLATQALPQLKLLQRLATDFQGLEANSFDAVILNSVVQYFPSLDYFVQVLEQAIHVVAPAGFIFIGDLRNLRLLAAFHAAVQLHQAAPTMSWEQLQQRFQMAIFAETELLIDPAFFQVLKTRFPRLSQVQVQLTRGRDRNELTQFRYNVILQIEANPSGVLAAQDLDQSDHQLRSSEAAGGDVEQLWLRQAGLAPAPTHLCLNWTQDSLSRAIVRQHLVETQPALLQITGIPNDRVITAVKAAEWLAAKPEAYPTAGQMRQALAQRAEPGIDPEDWWDLAAAVPYTVEVSWADTDATGRYDLIFQHQALPKSSELYRSLPQPVSQSDTWSMYANHPLQAPFTRHLIPQLRSYLAQNLPEYMVPSALVVLAALPLTPNGKVNRHALPAPEWLKQERVVQDALPQTAIEKKLATIWTDLLGIKSVGIHDNFFELGGHSLLATQLASRIRDAFGVELPLRSVFEMPAIAPLAASIADLQSRQIEQPAPRIVPLSREAHRRLRSSLTHENPGR